MIRCSLFGLEIESDFPLAPPGDVERPADLRIVAGPVGAVPDEPPPGEPLADRRYPNGQALLVSRDGSNFILRYPGYADFYLTRDCRLIEARCDPSVDPAYVPLLIEGGVLAFVLNRLGRTVIHASAVTLGDKAWAIVGPSGSGKSTIAALLARAGAALVTDDVLALSLGDGGAIHCAAGPTSIRLRPQAASLAPRGSAVSPDARTLYAAPRATLPWYPLAALLIPRPDAAATSISVRTLSPREAFLAMAANPRVLSWRSQEDLARDTEISAAVARKLPMLETRLPWGPPFPPELGAALKRTVEAVLSK